MTTGGARLFWLGAGASRPARGLLGRELREAVLSELETHAFHGRTRYASGGLTIYGHASRILQLAPQSPEFEETVSMCMDPFWGEHMVRDSRSGVDPSDGIRGVQFAIALAIKNSITPTEGKEELTRFFRKVIRPKDVIFTMNYDLLAETYLGNLALRDQYLVDATLDERFTTEPPGLDLHTVRVLHLHGSYGAFVCDRCRWVHPASDFVHPADPSRALDLLAEHQYSCHYRRDLSKPGDLLGPRCGGNLSPAIIPPLSQKELFASPTLEAWRSAYNMAGDFDELTIVGWSLPPFDSSARSLLRQVIKSSHPSVVRVAALGGGSFERFKEVLGANTSYIKGGVSGLLDHLGCL